MAAGWHKMGSFAQQSLREQSQHDETSHDFNGNYSTTTTTTTTRHTASSPNFISDSLKWLRWRGPQEEEEEEGGLDEPNDNYSTVTMNLLVSKHFKSRYQKSYSKISPPRPWHLLPTTTTTNILFYLPLLVLLLLNLVQESHCNPAPSGFFISGHPIPCTVGKPVDILEHIPFADPSLRLCYGCSCPMGSVVCTQLEDQSNCDYQRSATGVKTPVAPTKSIKHSALGNRASPTTTLLAHHSHHSHHHGSPIVGASGSGGGAGKAKGLGVPRKVKTTVIADASGQVQQPPVTMQQQQQQQQHKKSLGTPRSLRPSGNEARGVTRSHHYGGRHHSSRHIVAKDQDEEYRLRETKRPPTPYPYVAEILQTPAMPVDDPRHHEHAAAVLNLPLAKYLEKRTRHMKDSSNRQTPEPTTTTTTTTEPTTTTTPAPLAEEPTEEPTTDTDQTTTITTTTTLSGQQGETTTTNAPELITWPSGDDQSTEKPNIGLPEQPASDEDLLESTPSPPCDTQDSTSIAVDNNHLQAGGYHHPTESPTSGLIERDQAVVVTIYDNSGNQAKKPELELNVASSSPPTSTLDVNNHLNQNSNHPNLMIDNHRANEIMEQVSHDGILYIAIGVEAFILMSIIAMMIIFYLFREKTPPDELPQYHQALQMPRRSPSLEKA